MSEKVKRNELSHYCTFRSGLLKIGLLLLYVLYMNFYAYRCLMMLNELCKHLKKRCSVLCFFSLCPGHAATDLTPGKNAGSLRDEIVNLLAAEMIIQREVQCTSCVAAAGILIGHSHAQNLTRRYIEAWAASGRFMSNIIIFSSSIDRKPNMQPGLKTVQSSLITIIGLKMFAVAAERAVKAFHVYWSDLSKRVFF